MAESNKFIWSFFSFNTTVIIIITLTLFQKIHAEENFSDILLDEYKTIEQYSILDDEHISEIIDSIVTVFFYEYSMNFNYDKSISKKQITKAKNLLEGHKSGFRHKLLLYVDLLEHAYLSDQYNISPKIEEIENLIDLANRAENLSKFFIESEDEHKSEISNEAYHKLLAHIISLLLYIGEFDKAEEFIERIDPEMSDTHLYRAMQAYCNVYKDEKDGAKCAIGYLVKEIESNYKATIESEYPEEKLMAHHNLFYLLSKLASSYDLLGNKDLRGEALDNFIKQIEYILGFDNQTLVTGEDKSFFANFFNNQLNKHRILVYFNYLIIQETNVETEDLGIEVIFTDQKDEENRVIYGNKKIGTYPMFQVERVLINSLFDKDLIKKGDYILAINGHDLYDTHISDINFYKKTNFLPILLNEGLNKLYILRGKEIKTFSFKLEHSFFNVLEENIKYSKDRYNDAFKATQILMNSAANNSLHKLYERKKANIDPILIKEKQDLLSQKIKIKNQLLNESWVSDKVEEEEKYSEFQRIESRIDKLNEEINVAGGITDEVTYIKLYELDEIIDYLKKDEVLLINFDLSENNFQWIISGDGFVKLKKILPHNSMEEYYLADVYHGIQNYRDKINEKAELIFNNPEVSSAKEDTEGFLDYYLDVVDNQEDLKKYSEAIYKYTIKPNEKYIKNKEKLIIVSGGAFSKVPFSSLYMGDNKYLNDKYTISNLINLQALEMRSDFSEKKEYKYVGIANPKFQLSQSYTAANIIDLAQVAKNIFRESMIADRNVIQSSSLLPETESEVRSISKNFKLSNRRLLLGANASEQNIKTMSLSEFDIINFATHTIPGAYNSEPGLMLSLPKKSTLLDDGILTPGEISNLDLNAKLVILSACNTASGECEGPLCNEDSEILSGLGQAFLYAGAENLVVSHWNVETNSTVEIMTKFFEYWLKKDYAPAEALKHAKIDVRNMPEYNHPIYWAAFSYYGL